MSALHKPGDGPRILLSESDERRVHDHDGTCLSQNIAGRLDVPTVGEGVLARQKLRH